MEEQTHTRCPDHSGLGPKPVSVSGCITALAVCLTVAGLTSNTMAQNQPPLYTQGRSFDLDSHIVSTSVFHWYRRGQGQLSGPWVPLGGRESWTGEPEFWKGQIKQIMSANIDMMYVHLYPRYEQQRINLFDAMNQMRADGYDVPKV